MCIRDRDYIVQNGEVKIVDEFTGRIMEGRRYSEGLHQAIEAKEGVLVRAENQTMATITLQNYFRLYDKLSGMTGTAKTEDAEFRDIYKLPVEVIPSNRPVIREELPDLVYRTVDAKFNAVADDVAERHARQQPCLVGTISIESSERLSSLLSKRGIKHSVLNAKFHEQEANIVAQAGRAGAVTIATNMAGRGTDILLGGNPEYLARDILAQRGIEEDDITDEQWEAALAEAREICAEEARIVRDAGGLAVIGTCLLYTSLTAGVVDPTKVTRSALQNAASIAGLLLTTECVIADKPEKKMCIRDRWCMLPRKAPWGPPP